MKKRTSFSILLFLLIVIPVCGFAEHHSRGAAPDGSEYNTIGGDDSARNLLPGRAFVLPDTEVPGGYGRYTYLLLVPPTDDAATERNRELLDAFLYLEPAGAYDAGAADRAGVNLITVPLRQAPASADPDANWVLAHYDYERSAAIRRAVLGLDAAIPYAVRSPTPLAQGSTVEPDQLEEAVLSGGGWSLIEFVEGGYPLATLPAEPTRGARLTGRAFLKAGDAEARNYGLYSYLLFAERPTESTLPLYVAALDAYLNVSDAGEFEEAGVDREELNVFYLPVLRSVPDKAKHQWLLEQYDFARAQVVLRVLDDGNRGGPYIISYARPLTSSTDVDYDKLLVQDLSGVPADLAFLWVKEFISQARQPQYWNTRSLQRFMLSLRTSIAVAARAFVEVRSAHADVSSFLEDKIRIPE